MARIISSRLNSVRKLIEVTWRTGAGGPQSKPSPSPGGAPEPSSLYPYVWLRDNCQCSDCFHPVSKARLLRMKDLDIHAAPQHVQVASDQLSLSITWSTAHVGHYDSTWLWDRRFSDDVNKGRLLFLKRNMKTWGNEMIGNIPSESFVNLINDDRCLYKWIVALEEEGLFIIKAAPPDHTALKTFAARIAFLRTTSYGEICTVTDKHDPSNLAFTTASLGLHTDLPYYTHMPGIQMLHCVKQTTSQGGDNDFADGFHVANQLRHSDPETFKILSTAPVDFWDFGTDYYTFHKLDRKPVISVDHNQEVSSINYNNQVRDSYLSLPLEDVPVFYAALKKFDDLLYDKENLITTKLADGDIMCFNNIRVLHGRRGYTRSPGTERHLETAYVDWDEVRSRRRLLERNGIS